MSIVIQLYDGVNDGDDNYEDVGESVFCFCSICHFVTVLLVICSLTIMMRMLMMFMFAYIYNGFGYSISVPLLFLTGACDGT